MKEGTKSKSFSYRPKREHAPVLEALATATERPKSFFLDKALEAFLPELEKRYATELAALRAQRERLNENVAGVNSSPARTVDNAAAAKVPLAPAIEKLISYSERTVRAPRRNRPSKSASASGSET